MPTTDDGSNVYTQLRDKAEKHLEAGTTSTESHWSVGVEALRLLHRLSSNSESAEDALKLLHELQVHQVELDLQREEIIAREQALAEDLVLYREAYNCAPLGYFVVDRKGIVILGNRAAAKLFDIEQDDLKGRPVDSFLSADTKPPVSALVQRIAENGTAGSCAAITHHLQRLLFLASYSPTTGYVLLTCCEYPDAD